ncbi:MAG: type II toxin-antitoxin system RelB/DinJ family antitoxin [Oscillospiraceae bacterium]|nr:type II toxin-antitoxin system RelB/DinJ family antitoxin [Oscillospiraceae bacterium]
MATTPTQIRVDSEVKQAATELFKSLGLDMSGAVNLFLHQCVLRGGLPFSVTLPKGNGNVARFGAARGQFSLPSDYLERSAELDRQIERELLGEQE